ncbi:MAG: hypothetical protein Q8M47_12410 [Devosia sp.]|jgi:hypothetical protein|nr:hypothetical protein [Devosia sp.]
MTQPHAIETHIDRPIGEVYRFIAKPQNYPRWAAVEEATFRQVGPHEWATDTDFGPRVVRFSPPNDDNILDHAVYAAGDEPVMMPLRLTRDGEGTLVTFMFTRRPGMNDEQLASALEWIRMDFAVLKSLLEA